MSFHSSRVLRLFLVFIIAASSLAAFGATATALIPALAPHGAHVAIAGTGLDAAGIGVVFFDPTGAAVPATIVSRSVDAIEAVVPVQATSGLVRVTGGAGTIGTFDFTVSSDPALVKITTLAADLKQPSGTFVSTAGVIYVADRMHHQIRVIAPDGTSRVLGTGKPGLLDGSSATAQFNEPRGVVFDALRSILYVADTGNNVVRKITADGVVSTLAGSGHPDDMDGVGAGASFKNPVGLALDASGNVLVADMLNHSIRRITPDGVVTTLAGGVHDGFADGPTAQALFKLPEGVAVSADGSVYVADTGNNLLRRIANGNVTTIAGTGHPGLVDGGTAIAEFKEPASIAVDDSGALLVADRGNDAIRRVANGLVATIAPNVGWKAPSGVASEGVIVIGDSGNDAVRVLYRALSVSAVYPSRGLTTGGNVIRVFGTGFVPGATKVTIGGTLADVAYVAPSEMLVTVPAGAVGSVDVKVETAAGSVALSGGYTYVSPLQPPTITSVAPQKGTPAGGQTLTITGANFVVNETTVTIGGIPASATVLSSTQLTIVTPAHAAGAVDVTVTTSAGSATLPSGFTYIQPPVITSFFRFGRPRTPILINGSGFDPNPTGNTVLFGNVPAVVTAATATSISTIVPDLAHTGLISVTTAAGLATSAQTFIVFTLSEIAIPSQPALDAGASVQLSAQGTYTDGFKGDLTTLATWSSNAPPIATVSSTGLVTAVDTGQATISASIFGVTGTTIITVKPPAPPPPDPSTIATPTNPTIVVPLSDSLRFLYEGPNAIQTGVPLGTITDERATLLRGRVLTIDGTPLSGVMVSILGHPEFGQTISRANGGYDLVVNGGGSLVVKFEKTRYIPAQRRAIVNWNEQKVLDDVALVAYDANVTTIALGAADAQVARGSIVSDTDGTRRATLIFPPNTGVGLVMPDGTTKFVTSLNVRATEFSVGPNGPNAMPAALPASSAYTYCVELSADEAVATGATTVNFSRPVPFYVENFLNFPVGGTVPSGYYDRTRAAWLASTNGRVVKVVSITNGLADLDITGHGAASQSDLVAFGIDDAERQKLATMYAPGQSLWRVPITHFTPWDHNWPPIAPPTAVAPGGSTGPTPATTCPCPAEAKGSIVDVHNQTLSESIPITGTPFSLVYNSSRVSNGTRYKFDMALSGATIPQPLRRIDLAIQVAGRSFRASYSPATNLKSSFAWDGRDAYGRVVQGAQNATVTLSYVYGGTYAAPVTSDQAFAEYGFQSLNVARVSSEWVFSRTWSVPMGQMSMQNTGFGGWTLDAQHFYDGNGRVLYDGVENRDADPENIQTLAISAAAGGKCCTAPASGSLATSGFLDGTASIGFLPDGSYYVGNAFSRQPTIFRVDTNGIITTYAGGDFFGFTADGPIGPGSALGFTDIATGPDGTLYVNEPPRVRKIVNGFIKTIEGDVSSNVGPCSVDGLPAASVDVGANHIVVGPDGTVYLASGRVYAITSDGIIHRIAGSCDFSATYVDGGPALTAPLNAQIVTVGRDGTLYIGDSHGTYRVNADGRIFKIGGGVTMGSNTAQFAVTADGTVLLPDGDRIRAIAPDNVVTTLVGGGVTVFRTPPANGTLARAAGLASPVEGVQIAPDGSVYVVDPGIGAVFKTQPIFPSMRRAGTVVPSPDGTQAYVFQNGRHTQTIDSLTNVTLYSFSYDTAGNLTAITDSNNNTVTIERDGATGQPTAIVAPGGQRTTLALTNGNLTNVADPGGLTHAFTYNAAGILETFTDPRHNTHRFSYDENGLLSKDQDAAGGFISLIRTAITGGFSVLRNSAEGRTQRYDLQIGSDLIERRAHVGADGLATTSTTAASQQVRTFPDGTTITTNKSPDPRFGSAAPFTGSATIKFPSGLTMSVTRTVSPTLSDPSNPLSLLAFNQSTVTNGATWSTSYTAANHTALTRTPAGRTTTSILDTKGRLLSMTLPNIAPVQLSYDASGLLIAGSEGSRTTTFGYDDKRRLTSVTDPLNRTVKFGYDGSDRMVTQTLPGGRTVAFQYDENGNVTSVTPASRPAHSFAFTSADLLSSYVPPSVSGTGSTTYAYNNDHQLRLITRPDSSTVSLQYDPAGRLSLLTTPTGDSRYQYNDNGLLSSLTAPDGGTLTYSYDGSLPITESWAGTVNGHVQRAYDGSLHVVNENGTAYQYDADGLMSVAGALTIQRDSQNGVITGSTLGNLSDTRTYNSHGEPLTYTAAFNGNTLLSLQYTRDDAGRILQIAETVDGATSTVAYGYDNAGHLSTVTRDGAAAVTYTYDDNGNRLSRATGSSIERASYDAQDRLLSYADASFTYAPNGELAAKTDAGGTTRYSYDAVGNLQAVTLSDGTLIEYVIDGRNRRVGKKVNGVLVRGWLYAGQLRPVAELDGSGATVSTFIYGTRGNVPDYMIRNGITYRIISDHLGSPRYVIDTASMTLVQKISYDELGTVLSDSNPGFQPFGFAGGLYDVDTRLVRFGARDYDPHTGRWTMKEPLGFSGGSGNLYEYAFGDPVNFIDVNGKNPALLVPGIVGAVAGAATVTGYQIYENIHHGRAWNACFNVSDIGIATGVGFLAGITVPAVAPTLTGAAVIGAAANIVQTVLTNLSHPGEPLTVGSLAISAVVGAVSGPVGGSGSSGVLVHEFNLSMSDVLRNLGAGAASNFPTGDTAGCGCD